MDKKLCLLNIMELKTLPQNLQIFAFCGLTYYAIIHINTSLAQTVYK